MFKEVIGQRTRLDDRVSPVIHPDSLGEELATHAVRLALDRVDAQTHSHHQAASPPARGPLPWMGPARRRPLTTRPPQPGEWGAARDGRTVGPADGAEHSR